MDRPRPASPVREAAPILLAGLDHSGKTALRAALNAHPSIHIVRHVELWTRLRTWFDAGPSGRERVIDSLTSGKAGLEIDRDGLSASAAAGDFPALVREFGRQVCDRTDSSRWGLQEALLELQAATALEELPDARIIQLIRDPRTRYAEMRRRGAVGRGGLAAETAAWVASARAGSAAAAQRPVAYRVVRYESLLEDHEATLCAICEFIGEPFVKAVVESPPPPMEAAESLSPRELAFVQDRAAAELEAHGYALLPLTGGAAMLPQRLADASRWQLGRLSWRRRTRHLRPPLASQGG